MATLSLTKLNGSLIATSELDSELIAKIKNGAVIECEYKQKRNPAFHRKFFALLNLAFDYYEPKSGLIPDSEMQGIMGLAKHLGKVAGGDAIVEAARDYARGLLKQRAGRFDDVQKDFESFRRWAISEAGYFELKQTPKGITKVPASISFASMDQDTFDSMYTAVFNTLWRFVLSSVFGDEQEAQKAVDQLMGFA